MKNLSFYFIFLILLIPANFVPAAYAESGKELSAGNYIKHAKTCFWFGVAEKGNMQCFRQGLAYLDQAEQLINQTSLPVKTSKKLIDKLKLEIKFLRLDFKNQMEVHFDTLFGVFPLVRLLAPSLFADALATGTFELVDDPAVMASTSAGYRFCREIIAKWSACPQLNVVFTSIPNNKALEHELLYIFNSFAKFFVHNFHEVTTALSSIQIKTFQSGIITPDINQSLCKAFNVQELLIVTIREIDKIDQDYFCSIEGKVYNLKKDAPTHFFSNMGYSRDRNAWLMPIILTNICNFSITSGNFESSASYLQVSFPRKRESSGFTGFLDSRFHGNDVYCQRLLRSYQYFSSCNFHHYIWPCSQITRR